MSTRRPIIQLQPSVTETTVIKTTTTTTTYAPIQLPALPPAPKLTEEEMKNYPLLNVKLPRSLRAFELEFPGGGRGFFKTAGEGGSSSDTESEDEGGEIEGRASWRVVPNGEGKPSSSTSGEQVMGVLGLASAMERYAPLRTSSKRMQPDDADDDYMDHSIDDSSQELAPDAQTRSRKRQRADVPLSPLPSPRISPERVVPSSPPPTAKKEEPLNPDIQLATLMTLPSLLNHYTRLPAQLQSHLLLTFLRHSPLPVLRQLHSVLTPTLSRDFLGLLPPELGAMVCSFLSISDLVAGVGRVCRRWKSFIDSDGLIWRDVCRREGLWVGGNSEDLFVDALLARRRRLFSEKAASRLPHPYKILFKSRRLTQSRWAIPPPPSSLLLQGHIDPNAPPPRGAPKHISFSAHGSSVVTCLLVSPNQDRIISASDDHTIRVFNLRTGVLEQTLDGHEGGVWALSMCGERLVSGSTDRTVRVWDLRREPNAPTPSQGKCTHIFGGHTSTVRCLAIIRPEWIDMNPTAGGDDEETKREKEKWPKRSLIVTGSRDHSLRVWTLPRENEPHYFSPSSGSGGGDVTMNLGTGEGEGCDVSTNPYHRIHLTGHQHAVRALAARGRTLVSGSYDTNVRVWDVVTGACLHVLCGHAQKVYSVVLDPTRHQCMSGSMDGTVRIWSLISGECVASLGGHQSLVGLLGLSPSYLVSAAADSTLRVWNPRTGDCRNVLVGHTGAITCFVHDEWKAVSGSDGTLKVWDVREGVMTRELLSGIQGVWQVAFEGRWCVAASSRVVQTASNQNPQGQVNNAPQQAETVLDVWDFGADMDSLSSPTSSSTSILKEDGWIGEPSSGVYDEDCVSEEEDEDEWLMHHQLSHPGLLPNVHHLDQQVQDVEMGTVDGDADADELELPLTMSASSMSLSGGEDEEAEEEQAVGTELSLRGQGTKGDPFDFTSASQAQQNAAAAVAGPSSPRYEPTSDASEVEGDEEEAAETDVDVYSTLADTSRRPVVGIGSLPGVNLNKTTVYETPQKVGGRMLPFQSPSRPYGSTSNAMLEELVGAADESPSTNRIIGGSSGGGLRGGGSGSTGTSGRGRRGKR
ncbi:hypothetical protein DL96DRAFT_1698731 [Flagelloscypha sp. PMI_526]|nr:hypothetical protein DL96DRAFT_1698731 [Flagelloscypha sp. PMI_526]